jgi:predicted NAD-dependent protein-ADP-ribosyltransferase YbiA (DUF1768 family)
MGPQPTVLAFFIEHDNWLEHLWPSNFWIEDDGTCIEAEMQADKHSYNPWLKAALLRCGRNPWLAKRAGRNWVLNKYQLMEWDNRKRQAVTKLIRQKLIDHPQLIDELLATGDGPIVEVNFWHDNEWGDCRCRYCRDNPGNNILGKIWMALREEFRPAPSPPKRMVLNPVIAALFGA